MNDPQEAIISEKLKAVREAVEHSFPTADIDQMLREIEQGHNESESTPPPDG